MRSIFSIVINLSGAIFFHFSIRSAIVLFNASLLAGVMNGLSPLFTRKEARVSSQETSASSVEPSRVSSQQSPASSLQPLVSSRPVTIPTFPQFRRLQVGDRAEIERYVQQFPP